MKPNIQELMASLPEPIIHHIEHLERMRQDFVANVSHELRTPLTVIHGYLEALLNQASIETHPWKNIFTQMHQQTKRMENLIEDLLLLSRLECEEDGNCKRTMVQVPSLLNMIFKEAKTFGRDLEHDITLEVAPFVIYGFESELRSLFSNIIFNAIKYTPAHGKIIIRWYHDHFHATFSVVDTGIGIKAEHIPRLTERFYRVDPGRSRTSGGTGLGLAIAKHVLLRHEASLHIESELGKGSLFLCRFPLAAIPDQSGLGLSY